MNINGNMKNKYLRNLDYRVNTADYFIINNISPSSTVLEIGTSSGYISKYLVKEKKCKVTGIDFDKELLDIASEHLEKAVLANLNEIDSWKNEIENDHYDFIICQDVLEHLYNIFEVLIELRKKLKKTGKLIVSVPNVNHSSIIMELLDNSFDYEQTGILDNTHLKFFTSKTFVNYAMNVGYKLEKHEITYLVPEQTSLKKNYCDYSLMQREVCMGTDNSHAFQNLFVLQKSDGKIKSNLLNLKNEINGLNNNNIKNSYDEITIKYNKLSNKIFTHNDETIAVLEEDTNCITIIPSIRIKKYNIQIYINDNKYKLTSLDFNDVIILDNQKYISYNNQKLNLTGNFKKNDKLKIVISDEEFIAEKLMTGKLSLSSELINLKRILDNYEVVSFDLYDTLILRNVLKPEDIFKIIEKKYKINNFTKKRKKAEQIARLKTTLEDIKLDDIYEYLDLKEIEKYELEIEEKFTTINQFMKEIYDYCLESNKKIFLITDMYLPQKFLEKILEKLDIKNYEKLYISGDIGKLKSTGNLFDYVKEKENINKEKWIHIGNDYVSDIVGAKKKNINTYHYKSPYERYINDYNNTKVKESINYLEHSILTTISINKIYSGKELKYFEKLGMLIGSPIYFGFTKYLMDNLKDEKNVYFLSRDAYVPYCIFELLKNKMNLKIDTRYLYTSRKVYQLPSLADSENLYEFLIERNINLKESKSVKDIFDIIGVDTDLIEKEFLDTKIENDTSAHIIIKLQEYDSIIRKKLTEQKKIVAEYLKQEKFDKYEKINIVDVGWRGSIQNAMYEITNKNIKGYYFGKTGYTYEKIQNDMFSYLTSFPNSYKNLDFSNNYIMMIELLFSSSSPTLKQLSKDNNSNIISPLFDSTSSSYENTVDIMINSSIKVIEEYLDYLDYFDELSPNTVMYELKKFIANSNYDDAIKFSEISTNIGIGFKKYSFVNTIELEEFLENPQKVIENSKHNLFPNKFVILGITNQIEYECLLKKYNIKVKGNKYKKTNNIINKKNLIKAINNPKKAIHILKTKILNKI